MTTLRFKRPNDIPDDAPQMRSLFREITGLDLHVDGRDWVATEDSTNRITTPPDQLQVAGPFSPEPAGLEEIVSTFRRALPKEFEDFARSGHSRTEIPSASPELGWLGEISPLVTRLYVGSADDIPETVQELIYMISRVTTLHSAFVVSVCDPKHYQGVLSLSKALLMVERHGIDGGAEAVHDRGVLRGLLPSPVYILQYLTALTYLHPHFFALPLKRLGAYIFLTPRQTARVPSPSEGNFFEQFSISEAPAVDSSLKTPLDLSLSSYQLNTLMTLSVSAINNIFRYVTDYRHFTDNRGYVDHMTLLQANGAIGLLFNDLLTVNYSHSVYFRAKAAFSIVDKIANLSKAVSGGGNESQIFRNILSPDMGETIARRLNDNIKAHDADLANFFSRLTRHIFVGIHRKLDRQVVTSNVDTRTQQLRTLRNFIGHGAFIDNSRFGETFLESPGLIPAEIVYLPFVLVWDLALSPHRALSGYQQ